MRRRRAERREPQPDIKYSSKVVGELISMIMLKGKKSVAEKIVYGALDIAAKKVGKNDPLEVLSKALDNVKPLLELKSRRVGGATYQVPVEVKQDRAISLGLRWIRNYSRAKKGKPMQQRLADELAEAYKGEGAAVKKKEDTHKMAEANKAFSHFRW